MSGVLLDKQTALDLLRFKREVEKSQILNPGYIQQQVLKVMPRLSGVSLEYFWPPVGGIPAATGTSSNLAVGSATCYRATKTSPGNYSKNTQTAVVENEVSYAVGVSGKPIGCIANAYGTYTVIVEDCASTDLAPGTVVNDPVSGGTSRGIDFGYTVNV